MDRIDLSAAPSAMELTAAAWCRSPAPPRYAPAPTPRALPPRSRAASTAPTAAVPARSSPKQPEPAIDKLIRDEKGSRIEGQARDDAMRALARDVCDPAIKATYLDEAQAAAIVGAIHSGNRDRYLHPSTPEEIKRALFRMGCVGRRGSADKRYWLGPYGEKVRRALEEGDGS